MKKVFIILASVFAFTTVNAQGIKGLIKKATGKDNTSQTGLSTNDVASGLKEALNVGVKSGAEKLSAMDGFFKNEAIKRKRRQTVLNNKIDFKLKNNFIEDE